MLNIAIAGLGTVGAGVVRMLHAHADLIAARAGQPITIKAVSARDKSKKRDCDFAGAAWVDDPRALAKMPGVDVVVELIGGADGVAHEIAEAALNNGKHLVTANKALLATHGAALARLAEKNKLQLSFEASVAGGIPIIKTLREALAGNTIHSVRGILNGTCNYILTRMETGLSFDDALKEAQQKGYAEADPAADIDGHDAAHKIAILAALAFGTEPDVKSVAVEGIRGITPADLEFAAELSCRVKLLGVARVNEGKLEQHVGPALVLQSLPLAQVGDALNAVLVKGDFAGDLMLEGRGAGAEPTASSVVADIIDIARGHFTPAFGVPASKLKKLNAARAAHAGRTYMRLKVVDKPGVVADISAILREEGISIESFLQRGHSVMDSVPLVIVTHEAQAEAMQRVAATIARIGSVVEKPCVLPIEE